MRPKQQISTISLYWVSACRYARSSSPVVPHNLTSRRMVGLCTPTFSVDYVLYKGPTLLKQDSCFNIISASFPLVHSDEYALESFYETSAIYFSWTFLYLWNWPPCMCVWVTSEWWCIWPYLWYVQILKYSTMLMVYCFHH